MKVIKINQTDLVYQQERELRNEILLRPIGLPDYGWEKSDDLAHHFVAIDNNIVVGCVLLVPKENERAQLIQMAVKYEFQSKGIGRKLLNSLLEYAETVNIREVFCHARENAIPFYLKNNFTIYDQPFKEVGVIHSYMKYVL